MDRLTTSRNGISENRGYSSFANLDFDNRERNVLNKCAAYEDTGLLPEEIERLRRDEDTMQRRSEHAINSLLSLASIASYKGDFMRAYRMVKTIFTGDWREPHD